MHSVFYIPHIFETILHYYECARWPESAGILDPYCTKKLYMLAWVCREWRVLILPLLYSEVHVYVGNQSSGGKTLRRSCHMADPLNHLCHYYCTSNLDIIPQYAYPHIVVIYYEDDSGFVFRVDSFVSLKGFGERSWDSVTSFEILSNRALSARPCTSGLGPAVFYVLTHVPNIHMLSVDIEHVNLPGMVILNRILGAHAEMFTVLDLGTAPMCDVSNLVLLSLKTLAVDCSGRIGVHWLPTFDAKRLVSLELNTTPHGVFLHILQRCW